MTEIGTSLEPTLAAKLESLSIAARQRTRPQPKPLGPAWERRWLELEITHPDVQRLATTAAKFAGRWFNRSPRKRWCIVTGLVGTGKTHVSRRLCRWAQIVAFEAFQACWSQADPCAIPSAMHCNWLEYASPERCDADQWQTFLREIRQSSWVFIDDLGTETDQYRTGMPAQRLCELLDKCEDRFLWATMNIPPERWSATWDARVEDRLLLAEVVEMNAPSYRSEK